MKTLKNFVQTGGFKVILLIAVILLLLIPAAMIRNIIQERSMRAAGAEEEIMEAWGDQFLVLGPVLQIPLIEYEEVKIRNDRGEEKTEIREIETWLRITPGDLVADAELATETKKRGIFSVPLFAGEIRLKGNFDTHDLEKLIKPNQKIFPEKAELVIALSNQRGIREITKADWNGGELDFISGGHGFGLSERYGDAGAGGIHSFVTLSKNMVDNFDITMGIQGGKSLRMVPLGDDTRLHIKADWPSPSFQGAYLPAEKNIDEHGFDARWQVNHLSRNIPSAWVGTAIDHDLYNALFGVNFFKALDHYDLNTRAAKYALLFIIVPFLSLFILENLLKRNIHPAQYLLAGIGNLIFYLLLLAFSEHLPFPAAYWIAAPAVTLMLALYSHTLLGARNKCLLMAVVMMLCYTFLYFTLQSEDWALLIGALGCFAITAAVMFFTRKLDWYGKKTNGGGSDTDR
ncbi:MAG: cell envelope integrity protein CreD [Treponema sp.]|jgi:inner membrane protein|nr:cell envelope integrity protein CreD [Treponema sp.]